MFSELLDVLKSKTILTNKNVLDLRWFISNKYPDMSPKEAAKIFADSINRIIDKHLPALNDSAKPQIKTLLFEDAIKKPSFEITCSDVFKCCIQTKDSSDSFFEELTKWTTGKSGKPVSKARLTQFVRKLHLTMNDYPYKNINDIIDIVEKDTTELNPFASAKFSIPSQINNNIENKMSYSTIQSKPVYDNNASSYYDAEETTIDHETYNQNYGQVTFSKPEDEQPLSSAFDKSSTNNMVSSNTGKHSYTRLSNSYGSSSYNQDNSYGNITFSQASYGYNDESNANSLNNQSSFGQSNNQSAYRQTNSQSLSSYSNTNSRASYSSTNTGFTDNHHSQASYGQASHSFGRNSYADLNSQASFKSEGFTHVNYNEYKPIYSFEKSSMKVFDENEDSIKRNFLLLFVKLQCVNLSPAVGVIAASTILYNGATSEIADLLTQLMQ